MGLGSTNDDPPFFGQAEPVYPPIEGLLLVTDTALAGEDNIYPALLCQYATDVISGKPKPRGRIAVYLTEPNGAALFPGRFYDGTLFTAFQGLPLYATTCCPAGGAASSSAQSSSSKSSGG